LEMCFDLEIRVYRYLAYNIPKYLNARTTYVLYMQERDRGNRS
jgi:hypothetical protein